MVFVPALIEFTLLETRTLLQNIVILMRDLEGGTWDLACRSENSPLSYLSSAGKICNNNVYHMLYEMLHSLPVRV